MDLYKKFQQIHCNLAGNFSLRAEPSVRGRASGGSVGAGRRSGIAEARRRAGSGARHAVRAGVDDADGWVPPRMYLAWQGVGRSGGRQRKIPQSTSMQAPAGTYQ
jgi:hypothetical protein